MTFLEKTARDLLEKYNGDLSGVAMVFPNKRAGLYFRKALQGVIDRPVWSPGLYSFDEWASAFTGIAPAETIPLVFSLYRFYSKSVAGYKKNFEDFYFWGKMLLADFDEIDRCLADPDALFRNLAGLKGIEDITLDTQSPLYRKYLGFWTEMGEIYRGFRKELLEGNSAYPGLIYRMAAEKLDELPLDRWKCLVFTGFNALNPAEETIIRRLAEKGRLGVYLDMDPYFTENPGHEAGRSFRGTWKDIAGGEVKWADDGLSGPKTITVSGTSTAAGQAKLLGLKLVETLDENNAEALEKTVIVLADETMLFPVLNSLPPQVKKANITMGFPLRDTLAHSFVQSLFEARGSLSEKEGASFADHAALCKLLEHPYTRSLMDSAGALGVLRGRRTALIDTAGLALHPGLAAVFGVRDDDAAGFLERLAGLMESIAGKNGGGPPKGEGTIAGLEAEFVCKLYMIVNQLKELVAASGIRLNLGALEALIGDIMDGGAIPFVGEPLEGLQIMGMLETQALDFDNVFILSVNEGRLPSGKNIQTFLPHQLRKAMGLPTVHDREAVYSYHFYRLLKRAGSVHLLYTEEGSNFEKSEKSRFIEQVLIEYPSYNPRAKIVNETAQFRVAAARPSGISIGKNGEILRKLRGMRHSATGLTEYLLCPLRFYYHRVLGLDEKKEVLESPDEALFGTIIHGALKELYRPLAETALDRRAAASMRKRLDGVIAGQFSAEGFGDVRTGRNRLYCEICKKLLERFLDGERADGNVKILCVEKNIEVAAGFNIEGRETTVLLKGKIDRMDEMGGVVRILDYKTGKTNTVSLKGACEVFEITENRKEAFQLLFYMLLAAESGESRPVRSGIYGFKNGGFQYLALDKKEAFTREDLRPFKEGLGELFAAILNPDRPFTQTENPGTCENCAFINLCCR